MATTALVPSSATTGAPIPLSYGYVWATGKRAEYYMLQNTGSKDIDYTRVGIWLLGHGEWDGCMELWINDALVWTSELDDESQFHFHRGADSVIGSGLAPSSSGPDQGVDSFFSEFPSAITPLAYSRIAYYAIKRKQAVENQTNDHQNDPTQWTDIAPIGLWRALRTRLFDGAGNMTGYAFTTNPAWHFVDVLLRRKLFPDYNIDLNNGPDDLSAAVRARFDWPTIYESAQYFDEILANGRRRFTGNYAFSAQTSLQAVLEQILLCCRSFCQEYAGKIALICDKPRSSVFTVTRDHVMPGSFDASDASLHTAANRYIGKFRDLLVPAAAVIAGITCADHKRPIVTTAEAHPFNTGDRIVIGGTGTVYDGNWHVYSVPSGSGVTTMTLDSKGSNYPTSIGAGGAVGLLYSRFKERAPEFWNKQNQLARGTVGLGIDRIRNKVKQELDYATSTYDQVSRVTRYERDRALGLDAAPYVTPPAVKLRLSMFAHDAAGNLACAIRPGDHITLADTANYEYAGEYEVLEPLTVYPPSTNAASSGDTLVLSPDASSGEIELVLGQYDESIMYDSTDDTAAGWLDVPGSDPGNDSNFTGGETTDGTFVFITGALPSGQVFELPSTGFDPANVLAWASPQGYVEYFHVMHVIAQCVADSNRKLTLQYEDGDGNLWPGDTNYAALAWRSPSAVVSTGADGMKWVELTLSNGEVICFGFGVLADGASFTLPAGFTASQMYATAFPHDTPVSASGGNQAHGVGASVSGTTAHIYYQDGSGNVWHGNAQVLVFAWKNNGGTMAVQAITGGGWVTTTLTDGSVFGVGLALLANGANFALPSSSGNGESLQAICGPASFDIVDHPAHGVGACYLDGSNNVVLSFEDGEGNVWHGNANVFGLFIESGAGPAVSVAITPGFASIASGNALQFSATVKNNANQSVTWAVDGIAGGSYAVGTIDAAGNYQTPTTAGSHTITATSVADPSATGSAAVTVYAPVGGGGGWLINGI